MTLLRIFASLSCLLGTLAVEEQCVTKTPCFVPSVEEIPAVDYNWYSSVKVWYTPLLHKGSLYRSSRDLLHLQYRDISEHLLYYKSCLMYKPTATGLVLQGFNGLEAKYNLSHVSSGIENIQPEFPKGQEGTISMTLTDNKSYVMAILCDKNESMLWHVMSVNATLDKASTLAIQKHAQKLGFPKEYVTNLRYELCSLP